MARRQARDRCPCPASGYGWPVLLLLVVATASSCNRLSPDRPARFVPGPPTIGEGGIGVSSQVQIDHPLFAGLTELVAGLLVVVHVAPVDHLVQDDA